MYIYIQSEEQLFTVGFYKPGRFNPSSLEFCPESDHGDPESAARRVNYLNGGNGFPFELKLATKTPFTGGAPGKFPDWEEGAPTT